MDLRGAEVRDFYKITNRMGGGEEAATIIKVPHYQRPYKWNEDLISQLIKDWGEEYSRNVDSNEYFAGSIVTVISEENGKDCHHLIDGQQRFTTIFLANYLLFLIIRVTLRQALRQNISSDIKDLGSKLSKAIKFLSSELTEKNILDFDKASAALSANDEVLLGEVLKDYLKNIGLTQFLEGDEGFEDDYEKKLYSYINKSKIRLSYDRDSYNEALRKSLSKIILKLSDQEYITLRIANCADVLEGSVEDVYLKATKQIFLSVKEIGDRLFEQKKAQNKYFSANPFTNSLCLIDALSSFLTGVKLCVVQTGNQDDAYTLFEVLNDRSLSLDDLDLIKNQFYKALCVSAKNQNLDNELLDNEINKREEQWGDNVFKNNSDTNKKLIAYLAISYITGAAEINLKKHDSFRDKVKYYLATYNNNYSPDILERDFNIFEVIKDFIDVFHVTAKNRSNNAIEAEFSDNTITYKTVHLLLALKYEGVLAGLLNFVLQHIKLMDVKDFDPKKAKSILSELVRDPNKHIKIHEQAKKIWQLVLVSKDFKKPKELSNYLILNNNVALNNLVPQSEGVTLNQLQQWANPWRFSSSDIKIKILFSRLLRLSVDHAGHLNNTAFHLTASKDDLRNLHLDHMEPSRPEVTNSSAFYKYGKIERDDDVNALGNMFPLPGNENIAKSNKPMYTAFDYLSKSGLKDHWLTRKTKKLFDLHCADVNGNKVPDQQFFTKRKEYLIEKFFEAIIM